ncbi:trace amine-associated receptor 13c-like [Nothobranchius furzeri]|uniref:trace amine-associated receptor 13c-like n=1 Tax=Nothobranchius furzeri TaxID=105023 RepID=UPI003904CB4F
MNHRDLVGQQSCNTPLMMEEEEYELCFPQLLNASCKKIKHSYFGTVFLSFILCFISLITVLLNLLLIISISYFRQLQTSTNLILLSLAVSDLFVGLLLFIQITLTDGCWYLGDIVCILYFISAVINTSASVGNMVLISIDRYVAICDPLHYPTKVTVKRIQLCISLCWSCSLGYSIVIWSDNLKHPGRLSSCSGECIVIVGIIEQFVDLFLTLIIPITVIILLYLRVFVVAVSQVQAMRSHVAASSQKHSGTVIIQKSELKAAMILGVVVVAFLMCLCPYYCVILTAQSTRLNNVSAVFVLCLFYFNSCLNPMIYAVFYPWFRKAIKLIVTLQVLKSGSADFRIL